VLSFLEAFGRAPLVSAEAPGRVNLLGEHTDYSGGFVLPIGIKQRTRVEIAPSRDERFHVYAGDLGEQVAFTRDSDASAGFGRYVRGCITVLEDAGHPVPPLYIRISSTVPIGVGLSSSAALEVAVLRCLREGLKIALDDIALALHARDAAPQGRYAFM
jgi:galactokinase